MASDLAHIFLFLSQYVYLIIKGAELRYEILLLYFHSAQQILNKVWCSSTCLKKFLLPNNSRTDSLVRNNIHVTHFNIAWPVPSQHQPEPNSSVSLYRLGLERGRIQWVQRRNQGFGHPPSPLSVVDGKYKERVKLDQNVTYFMSKK